MGCLSCRHSQTCSSGSTSTTRSDLRLCIGSASEPPAKFWVVCSSTVHRSAKEVPQLRRLARDWHAGVGYCYAIKPHIQEHEAFRPCAIPMSLEGSSAARSAVELANRLQSAAALRPKK